MTVNRQMAPRSWRRSGTWLWVLGILFVVAGVMAGAFAGHRYVAGGRLAAARVGRPAIPPASITTMLRLPMPEASAAFVLPAGQEDRLAVLAGPREPLCPPAEACLPPPTLDSFLLLDASTGKIVAQTPLDSAGRQPVTVAIDPRRQAAYVVLADAIEVFSTTNGERLGGFALPPGIAVGPGAGASATPNGTLLLSAQRAGRPILLGLNGATGGVRFIVAPDGAIRLDGPVFDAATGFAIILIDQGNGATLAAFGATDGAPHGYAGIPTGARLGPLDDARRALMLFGADGTTWQLPLAALAGSSLPAGASTFAPVEAVAALRGAAALGWNAALGHIYRADASDLTILDGATGRPLAALPLPVAWAPDVPLPVDVVSGQIFVPTDHGAIAVVHDAPDPVAHTLTPDTAAALARAAVAHLLPPDQQDPSFVTPDTFTIGAGARDVALWAYSASLQPREPNQGTDCRATGHQPALAVDPHWQGPYCGAAQVTVLPAPAGASGVYDVIFTVTWDKLFVHRRTWTYRVASDGAVQLVSDAGDALP